MNRWLVAAGIGAAGIVAGSQALPGAPWTGGGFLWALAAALVVAAAVRGVRVAPRDVRALDRAAAFRAGIVLAGAVALYALLPRLALVASYRGDAVREEFIATTAVVVVGLLLLLFATDEGDVA